MALIFISHSSRDNETARLLKAWLEEERFEHTFLDFDKETGIGAGESWERRLYREIERCQAVLVVLTPAWLASKWCFAEFTWARAQGKPIFPTIMSPVGERLFASDIQQVDITSEGEGGLGRLARALREVALEAQGGFPWDPQRPPFPGMLSFQEEDAAVYFGRDDDIRALLERLRARLVQGGQRRLVLILGASGSGKSSLLRAGILPRLKREARSWIVLPTMRPDLRPLDELSRSIAIALRQSADWKSIKARLSVGNGTRALGEICADLRVLQGSMDAQVLLPIDQAEELFTISERSEVTRFLEVLSAGLNGTLPLMAAVTLRSDYLGHLQTATGLTARLDEHSLKPMLSARIPLVIEGPARVAGLSVEPALVHQATQDASARDALPLLAFAFRELWERFGKDKSLTLAEYQALGDPGLGLSPLENVVRRRADEVLETAAATEAELAALRRAFIPALARIGDDNTFVRRPAALDRLPAEAHRLLELLTRARLLVANQEPGAAASIEVVHEALLRQWPRLRGWLEEERDALRAIDALSRAAAEWAQRGRRQAWIVHKGERLREVLSAVDRLVGAEGVEEATADYLKACEETERAEAVELDELRQNLFDAAILARNRYVELAKERFKGEAAALESMSFDDRIVRNAIKGFRRAFDPGSPLVDQNAAAAINLVAMIRRAHRDGYVEGTLEETEQIATRLARELPTTAFGSNNLWNMAVLAEAHYALGNFAEANACFDGFFRHPRVGQWHVRSMLRQLRDVWSAEENEAGQQIVTALEAQAARLDDSVPATTDSVGKSVTAETTGAFLESTIGSEAPRRIAWLKTGLQRARAVCRIADQDGKALATGFLLLGSQIDPTLGAELFLITAAHLLQFGDASQFRAEFPDAGVTLPISSEIWRSPPDELDTSILRLNGQPSHLPPELEALPIATTPPTIGQSIYILGHPYGGELHVSLEEIGILDVGWKRPGQPDQTFLHYRSPTVAGNSGSPIFSGDDWTLVGLHHAGSGHTGGLPRLAGKPGRNAANEGIWIQSILQAVRAAHP